MMSWQRKKYRRGVEEIGTHGCGVEENNDLIRNNNDGMCEGGWSRVQNESVITERKRKEMQTKVQYRHEGLVCTGENVLATAPTPR